MAKAPMLLALAAAACGSTSGPTTLPKLPPPGTRALLVGPWCTGNDCTCRNADEADSPDNAPPAGVKRYEIRLGPTDNELWVGLDDMVLYKGVEQASGCFYVDLPPGEHQLTVTAQRVGGFAARVSVGERSTQGSRYYRTVELDCSGVCTEDALRVFKSAIAGAKNHAQDPCGSTKVYGATWETSRMPDSPSIDAMRLSLTLKVYKFETGGAEAARECQE